jgi:hypothetical protein
LSLCALSSSALGEQFASGSVGWVFAATHPIEYSVR